jgi:ABC-type Fe3+-hydroxamate transport system substrate-binding protein
MKAVIFSRKRACPYAVLWAPMAVLSLVLRRFCILRGGLGVYALASLLAFPPETIAGDRTIVDDLGFKVNVKRNIHRIVSLVPTNSEMVCLLDCERLKGGTRYDLFPEALANRIQLKQVEIIGGGFDANLEKIVQLQPDLILTNGPTQQRFAAPLKQMGYSVLSLWPRDMDELKRDFLLLGDLLEQQNKARRIIDEMQRRFTEIKAKAKYKEKKRVYLQMWTDPLITVGKSSFPDWLVAAAGGVNVFGDLPFDSGQISLESLIQRNPEVLIFLAAQEPFVKTIAKRPGWSSIRGVRDSHFCFIDEPDIRRSVDFLDGLAKIQDCLFAELRTNQTIPRKTK